MHVNEFFSERSGVLAGDLNIEAHKLYTIRSAFTQFNQTGPTLSAKNKYANTLLNDTPKDKIIDYILPTGRLQLRQETLIKEVSDHYPLIGYTN